jgi:hypothetical protein
MKLGINLYLWADQMHDDYAVLESLKQTGTTVMKCRFDLTRRHGPSGAAPDDLGLERTANTVIAPE